MVNERLAELYLRLLALYWRTSGLDFPESIDGHVPATDRSQAIQLDEGYRRLRPVIVDFIRDLGLRSYSYLYPKRWGFGGKYVRIDLSAFPSIDMLFFRERNNDLAWLKRFLEGGNSSGEDNSEVLDSYKTEMRTLDFHANGKFPITLLLILIMEQVIDEKNMKLFPTLVNGPTPTAPPSGMNSEVARSIVPDDDWVSDTEKASHANHQAWSQAGRAIRKAGAARFVSVEATHMSHPEHSSTPLGISSMPEDVYLRHNQGSDEVTIVTDDIRVCDGEDEYLLPAGSTIAVAIPAAMWDAADFMVQSFVYWVPPSESQDKWMRIQIPHQMVSQPSDKGVTLFLSLDEYFLEIAGEGEPALFLDGRTDITVGANVTGGLLQVFVMVT